MVYPGAENHNTVTNDWRWCNRSIMPRLSRTKNVKLTTIGVKWKNQGHRRPCRRPTSLQGEVRHRKVNHVPTCVGVWRSLPERRSTRGGALITG